MKKKNSLLIKYQEKIRRVKLINWTITLLTILPIVGIVFYYGVENVTAAMSILIIFILNYVMSQRQIMRVNNDFLAICEIFLATVKELQELYSQNPSYWQDGLINTVFEEEGYEAIWYPNLKLYVFRHKPLYFTKPDDEVLAFFLFEGQSEILSQIEAEDLYDLDQRDDVMNFYKYLKTKK